MSEQNINLPDLADIGQLDAVTVMGKKSIEARLALGLELYISSNGEEGTFQLYRNLLTCVEKYYGQFKGNLNCHVLPNATRITKIKDDPIGRWRTEVEKLDGTSGMGLEVFFDDTNEGIAFNATPWQISCLGSKPLSEDLSAISASMKIASDNEDKNNLSTLFAMTLHWCERLKPVHGSAGFCFAYTPAMETQERWTWSLMQRFPCIDHSNIALFTLRAGSNHKAIKGINWLTVLGDELVTRLGGVNEIQSQLGKECRIHDYNGGVIIIAGPVPQLGDTYSGFIPERYKSVAKVTRPILYENYLRPLLKLPKPIDSLEATLKWIKRFD